MLYGVIKESKAGFAGILSTALLLGGCGGGDSGGSSSSSSTSVSSASVVLDGGAIKGVIGNGQITAWSLEQAPGSENIELGPKVSRTVMTDSHGRFRLPIDENVDGWIMVELTAGNGTRMTCDVMPQCYVDDGKTVDFGETFPLTSDFRLRAAINLDTGNEVYLTPLSSMAVASAEQMHNGFTGANLEFSYQKTESSFGLNAGTLKLPPPDIVRLNGFTGSTDAMQLAVINAAFLSMVDGEQWDSIEEVLRDSEKMIQQQGSLSATDSSSAPAVKALVLEAAEQSFEIFEKSDITNISVRTALLDTADRNEAFSREIDSQQNNSNDNQFADNSTTTGGDSDAGGSTDGDISGAGDSDNHSYPGSTIVGNTTVENDGSDEVANHGSGADNATDELAANAARLSWSAPMTRVNGDSIAMGELQGYEIVYGRQADQLNESVSISENGEAEHQHTIEDLESGDWYFAIRVVDTDGLASTWSDVVSKSIRG